MSRKWSLGVSNCLVKWGISTDRWGRKYDHGMLKLTLKARLTCDKRMPKMDTDVLLTDADIKEHFETNLVQHLTVADTTKESMTIDKK